MRAFGDSAFDEQGPLETKLLEKQLKRSSDTFQRSTNLRNSDAIDAERLVETDAQNLNRNFDFKG